MQGLHLHPDFLTEAEEAGYLRHLDANPWKADIARRTQQYGYSYSTRSRVGMAPRYVGELPAWTQPLLARVREAGLTSQPFDQMSANEYLPGQGIALHTDLEGDFDDAILIVCLGSQCVMDFFHPATERLWSRVLPRRAVLLMEGEARYEWQHGIPKRQTDRIGGIRVPRGRRVSMNFRYGGPRLHQRAQGVPS